MSHKETAVETTCAKRERKQGQFRVYKPLQMSALQMLSSVIPGTEILLSKLWTDMHLTKPRHLNGFFFQLPLPSNYFLQSRGDSFEGQNFTAIRVQHRCWGICPFLRLIKRRHITKVFSSLISSSTFVINSCSGEDVDDGSSMQDI